MTNRLTAKEAKRIWLRVLFKHTGNSIFDEYLAKVIPRLQALKFTYGGRIKKEHKSYAYISKHFPALLRKLEEEINETKS
jgi:hypothetical protein